MMRSRLPATGRWIQHPTWRAAGAWKDGSRVGEHDIQEARSTRFRQSASNGAKLETALTGSRCDREAHKAEREAKVCFRVKNRRNAGAERQPLGP